MSGHDKSVMYEEWSPVYESWMPGAWMCCVRHVKTLVGISSTFGGGVCFVDVFHHYWPCSPVLGLASSVCSWDYVMEEVLFLCWVFFKNHH